jgi:hypothetical protein
MWLPTIESETQSGRDLVASKGKQVVTDVPMICLCSNSLTNNPSIGINSMERPQSLIKILEQKVNKTCEYDSKRKFQVSWASELLYSKLQIGVDGCVHLVKYKMCLEVEHKNKLLAPKWDSLHKHTN